jgi:hypothetical protein
MALPLARGSKVQAIDERLFAAAGLLCALATWSLSPCIEQRPPVRFNDPSDLPRRMRDAQGSHRGKRVKNITHGAETHHKQAKVGLRVQSSIFA